MKKIDEGGSTMDIGAAFRKIIKVDEASDLPEPEYEKCPHPYHKLGGWLGLIVFIQIFGLASIFVLGLVALGSASILGGLLRLIGKSLEGFDVVALIIFLGFALRFCLDLAFFVMILTKNPRFLRFYELLNITGLALTVFTTIASGFKGLSSQIYIFVNQAVYFIILSVYFIKSVRIRTYFGSGEYLKRSVLFKKCKAPAPADAAPYISPNP